MHTSFASGMNFYKLFWLFFIGCFMGVIIETLWCLFRLRKIESRKGLIYGPFNLVYGFGALVMTLALSWASNVRDLWILLIGTLIGGVYEYICSVFQEKAFGSVSWDYKDFPLNINGRINFLYCIFWGILALLWNKDLYPKMSTLIEMIPNKIGIALTWICFVFIVLDSLISAVAVYRMSERTEGKPPRNSFWNYIDKRYPDEKVRRVYPNMRFKRIRM